MEVSPGADPGFDSGGGAEIWPGVVTGSEANPRARARLHFAKEEGKHQVPEGHNLGRICFDGGPLNHSFLMFCCSRSCLWER